MRAGSCRLFLMALCVAITGVACESPARTKPWRHRPDANPDAAVQTDSGPQIANARDAYGIPSVRVWLAADPKHLNPVWQPTQEGLSIVWGTVFEPLIRRELTADGTFQVIPVLAESYRLVDGGREIRFALRKDVRFHDGRTLSAVDVQFSIDLVRGKATPSSRLAQALRRVVAVSMWGPRDLRVYATDSSVDLLAALSEIPILPAHVYAGRALSGHPANQRPVGTGPFAFGAALTRGVRLSAFAEYWGTRPQATALEFFWEPDSAWALGAAKRGELDVVSSLIAAHYPSQLQAPGLANDFVPLRTQPPWVRYLVFQTKSAPFDDVRVREAVSLLFDRTRWVAELEGGLARAVSSPVWPGGPGHGDETPPATFDTARANALLTEAGWERPKADEPRQRAGVRLTVGLLATGDVDQDPQRAALVNALRSVGFQVELRVGPAAFLRTRLVASDFELALVEWRGRTDDRICVAFATGGDENLGAFSDPQVDRLCAGRAAAWDGAERRRLTTALGQRLAETFPATFLTAPDPVGVVHRRLGNVRIQDGWLDLTQVTLLPAPVE